MSKRINLSKKTEKLNRFMKQSDRDLYYRMFHSRVLKAAYNYDEIADDVKKLIWTHFGSDSNIFYLGSRVIGLGYEEESDCDIFIDIGQNSYYRNRRYDEDIETIEILKEIFLKLPKEWTYRKINFSVPSLKAIHAKTGMLCDFSVTNGLAVHNSELLGYLFELQPEAVALFHYIKKWLSIFSVKFKGFTLTLLVVFYLQKINMLPTVLEVQSGVKPEIVIDGYAVQFDKTKKLEDYSLEELKYYKDCLKGFFKFYADFDFENNVICTFTGDAIEKECYYESIDYNAPITVAAPLLRRTNCSKYLSSNQLAEFIEACKFSTQYLEEYQPPKNISEFEFYCDESKLRKYYNDDYDF